MVSTSGYLAEIGALQDRHFPPSRKKLRIGILSYALMGALHRGQREDGEMRDVPAGILKIQTLRKLPTIAPKVKTKR
jgi:hypothetical protein